MNDHPLLSEVMFLLLAMAAIDGPPGLTERTLLLRCARWWAPDLSRAAFAKLFSDASRRALSHGNGLGLVRAVDAAARGFSGDRRALMKQLRQMVQADGVLAPQEIVVLQAALDGLGLSERYRIQIDGGWIRYVPVRSARAC